MREAAIVKIHTSPFERVLFQYREEWSLSRWPESLVLAVLKGKKLELLSWRIEKPFCAR